MLTKSGVAKGVAESGRHELRAPSPLTFDTVRIFVAAQNTGLMTAATRMCVTILALDFHHSLPLVVIQTNRARTNSCHVVYMALGGLVVQFYSFLAKSKTTLPLRGPCIPDPSAWPPEIGHGTNLRPRHPQILLAEEIH